MNTLKLVASFLVLSFFVACEAGNSSDVEVQNVSSGDELLSDNPGDFENAQYLNTPEMESQGIERSYENAPPLIPHTIEGMFKITLDQNQCMMCHMPEKAKEKNATQIPLTHFTDYRPEIQVEGDMYLVETTMNEVHATPTGNELNKAMYNCNLCHTPQANIDPMVANLFKADFRSIASKTSSDLSKSIQEGVK